AAPAARDRCGNRRPSSTDRARSRPQDRSWLHATCAQVRASSHVRPAAPMHDVGGCLPATQGSGALRRMWRALRLRPEAQGDGMGILKYIGIALLILWLVLWLALKITVGAIHLLVLLGVVLLVVGFLKRT